MKTPWWAERTKQHLNVWLNLFGIYNFNKIDWNEKFFEFTTKREKDDFKWLNNLESWLKEIDEIVKLINSQLIYLISK